MAIQLPSYERKVGTAPLQAPHPQVVNASTAPGIAALGQGIERLGAGIGHYAAHQEAAQARETAKADGLRVDTVAQQIAETKRQLLEDPGQAPSATSPDTRGFLLRSGQDAIKDSASVKDFFEKQTKQAIGTLSPSQQAAIAPIVLHEISSLGHTVDQHVNQQTAILQDETSKAIFTGKANEAASAAVRGDMDGVNAALGAGLGHLDVLAARNGWTPEIKAEKERAYTASTRQSVIETVLGAGNAQQASQLLERWGSTLDQDKLNDSKLRQRVDGAYMKQQAEGVAQIAWGLSKGSLDDAEKRVNDAGIADPQAKDLAISMVRQQADTFNRQQAKQDDDVLARISVKVSQARGTFTNAMLEADPDYLELRRNDGRAAAYKMVGAAKTHKTGDGGNAAGALALQKFRALVATNQDAALDVNVNEQYANIPEMWRERIREQQGKLGTAEGKEQAMRLGELDTLVEQKLKGMKPERARANRGYMIDWYIAREKELGKPPPRAEALQVLTDKLANGEVEEWGRNPQRTRAEAEARGETFIPAKADEVPVAPTKSSMPRATQGYLVDMRTPGGDLIHVPPSDVAEAEAAGAKKVGGK